MSNIKWSGIEQKKYGLTARWYVSAYYGNDIDVDSVGLYNPTTNVNGHGGKTRPFATLEKASQQASGVIVIDSGFYSISSNLSGKTWIGDGNVIISSSQINIYQPLITGSRGYNITYVSAGAAETPIGIRVEDCTFLYSAIPDRTMTAINCTFIESVFVSTATNPANPGNKESCSFIRCAGTLTYPNANTNNIFVSCQDLSFLLDTVRPVSQLADYSVLIGTVKTSIPINGKRTGVTIEDFKAHGEYFGESYSEVDLFDNVSGSGATVPQLKTLFCNYISPVYIDNYNEVNLHLKTTAPDILKYGGLNGTFIGALPVMHWFDAANLWDNYRDAVNTVDLEKDSVTNAIRIVDLAEEGTFRSTKIDLDYPIIGNPAKFYANLVYNIEGTIKEGVSNQRIDTTPDMLPDNTKNQRVVYDFKLAIAPNDTDPLGAFKNYELDRSPTVDADGNSNVDDLFNQATEAKQEIGAFMIEFTMRKIIID